MYRREVEGVDGQEHVHEAGQLVEVAAGAAGEPGQEKKLSTLQHF